MLLLRLTVQLLPSTMLLPKTCRLLLPIFVCNAIRKCPLSCIAFTNFCVGHHATIFVTHGNLLVCAIGKRPSTMFRLPRTTITPKVDRMSESASILSLCHPFHLRLSLKSVTTSSAAENKATKQPPQAKRLNYVCIISYS